MKSLLATVTYQAQEPLIAEKNRLSEANAYMKLSLSQSKKKLTDLEVKYANNEANYFDRVAIVQVWKNSVFFCVRVLRISPRIKFDDPDPIRRQ